MKKAIKRILSYLGAFLLSTGIIGMLLKWSTICFFEDSLLLKQIIITLIAFSCGFYITIKHFSPLD